MDASISKLPTDCGTALKEPWQCCVSPAHTVGELMPLCRAFDLTISPSSDGAVLRQASDLNPPPTLEELVRALYGCGDSDAAYKCEKCEWLWSEVAAGFQSEWCPYCGGNLIPC